MWSWHRGRRSLQKTLTNKRETWESQTHEKGRRGRRVRTKDGEESKDQETDGHQVLRRKRSQKRNQRTLKFHAAVWEVAKEEEATQGVPVL